MIENEKKFDLTVTIENTKREKSLYSLPIKLSFDVVLYKENHMQYLQISSEQGGEDFNVESYLYKDGFELLTITEWASNYWDGKNGAYRLTSISIIEKEDN